MMTVHGRIRRGCLGILFVFSVLGPVSAETELVTDSSFLMVFTRMEDGGAGMGALSQGRLTFDAQGSREVKAQVALDYTAAEGVLLSLHKAFVKARLGDLRLTMGKTRITWGEGFMYNAGDVIFGGGTVDLKADELRDDTRWLASAYWGWGDYSFGEAVVLPPDWPVPALSFPMTGGAAPIKPAEPSPPWETSAGARLYHRLGDLKLEGGYLYDGRNGTHLPFGSLQGALGDLNLHLSSSLVMEDSWKEETRESWEISAGAFWQWALGSSVDEDTGMETPSTSSLAFRLEALLRPWGEWEAADSPAIQSRYGLNLYPEVSWKDGTWTLFARSLVVPLDRSSQTTLALQWAPLQGFRLLGSLSAQAGDEGDTYGWDRQGGWQATLGSRVIF